MTAVAVAFGAMLVATLWFLSSLRWPLVAAVKLAVMMLNEEECDQLVEFMKKEIYASTHETNCDKRSKGCTKSSCPPRGQRGKSCPHKNVTAKGSNQYQYRITCKDCNQLLELNRAKTEKKVERQSPEIPPHECQMLFQLLEFLRSRPDPEALVYDADSGRAFDPRSGQTMDVWDLKDEHNAEQE